MVKSDFEQVFEALSVARVRYLIVGGVAVVLHGHPRVTADLDLVIALQPDNVRAAMGALSKLGYRPRAPVRAEDLGDPAIRQAWIDEKGLMVFSMWSPQFPATEIDVFVREPMPFDQMEQRAVHVDFAGLELPIAGIEDIISMKSGTGRSKDQQDIEELRLIAEHNRHGH